jgi:hypothetical protein
MQSAMRTKCVPHGRSPRVQYARAPVMTFLPG